MPKLDVHYRCSTKCHGHLGICYGHQNYQIMVSLGVGDDGKVILAKAETC
jgi:hypothetical protein